MTLQAILARIPATRVNTIRPAHGGEWELVIWTTHADAPMR